MSQARKNWPWSKSTYSAASGEWAKKGDKEHGIRAKAAVRERQQKIAADKRAAAQERAREAREQKAAERETRAREKKYADREKRERKALRRLAIADTRGWRSGDAPRYNPAARKRGAYRLGLEAARRNPAGDPGAALVAAERTIIFREAAVSDLAGAREFFLAGYQDGSQENPKAKSAFDRCAASVASKGGAYDPRAVCASAGRKKLGQAEMTRRGHGWKKNAPKKIRRNPRNPLETAESAFEGFHGEKAKHTFKLTERRHIHDVVWAFGPLVYLKVWLPSDRRKQGLRNFAEIEFDYEGPEKKRVYVTANEKRNQMFFDGGDQSVDLKVFGVPPEPHETVVLGEVSDAYYFTTKKHLGNQGGTAVYKHKLGEEGGELPTLIYHTLEKRLSLAGGSYTIPNEGVRN